jgi:hypothetical protein
MRNRTLGTGPILICIFALSTHISGQVTGPNVNMVSGTQWPGGDPFLQRQNEPSMAISSRNPLHMLAGANDYRTVDLPGVSGAAEPTGDAWLGLFKSFDGGQTWKSTLVPGYPQDQSLQGLLSPLKGLGAAADPSVRAGTNGMLYFSGLAFNRQEGGASRIFVATFTDDNNLEGGDSIRYLWTTSVKSSSSTTFEDKPTLAVDIPRSWSGACLVPALPLQNTQFFRAGTAYVAWTEFPGDPETGPANIMFSRSTDCGLTWRSPQQINGSTKINQGASMAIDPNTGALYIAWRVFASASPNQANSLMYSASFDGGSTFSKPALITNINPFDQGDTGISFRTNTYPAIAVDAASRVYVAWSQRGALSPCTGACGDARIQVLTGTPTASPHNSPVVWGSPAAVDPWGSRGHQIMPVLAFSAGKLTVAWYDLRYDDLIATYTPLGGGQYTPSLINNGGAPDFPSFGPFIADPTPPYAPNARRQTLDVRAAQAGPGNPPSFLASVQVSQYAFGSTADNPSEIRQLEVNPPNLPMFQRGTLPFIGDYIDIAGPTFIANHDGTWRFNNQPADPDFTHVVWTDNRNVIQPADGNWANYTPPTYGTSTASIFDPAQQRPACIVQPSGANTGDRNQDIYTAQLSPGLVVSARGNAKPLGTASSGALMQREFPVTVQNTTALTRFYRLTITSQPTGGAASFLQFPVAGLPNPLTQIVVQVTALSSTSRSIFVTSTDAHATVGVNVVELTAINGSPLPGGQTGAVTINSDISNPNISNPNISNTEIYNPNISNPNISNPNISNPNISNPNISNPNISNPNISNVTVANPNISNPNISNPNISNPNISNPNISNPNISNPNISNAALTDATWTVTNTGNTATAYSVKMLTAGQNVPAGVSLQLIISQSYNTPAVIGCTPAVEQNFVPVANIPNVVFATAGTLLNPAATDPTTPGIALLPGESAFVTMRVVDTTTSDPVLALQHFNPATATTPAIVSQAANTGTTTPPVALIIVPVTLPPATATGAYSQQLMAAGGTGTFVWSSNGNLPAGIQLSASGLLAGIPIATGSFTFTATVTSGTQTASTQLTLAVNPAPAIVTTALSAGDRGAPYPSQTLVATGGTAPLSAWSISSGFLPAGLSLSGATISGTLAADALTSTFTVRISDLNQVAATRQLTITVNPPPSITTTSLPSGEAGLGYSQLIGASGGTGTLTFTPISVDGLTLSSSGQLSGTPMAQGSFMFIATVTDALQVSGTQSLTLVVVSTLTLPSASLSAGDQGVVYPQQQLVAAGGAPPYMNWSWTPAPASSVPPGLSLGASTGAITGTPTAPGVYSFVVTVTDSLGVMASQTFSIAINLPPSITGGALPGATVGTPYNYTIPVSNGTAPFTWSESGTLPNGLTFANGTISGTPGPGSFAAPYDVSHWASSGNTSPSTTLNTTVTPNCLITVSTTDAVGANAAANFQAGSTPSSPCAAFGYSATGTGSGISGTWTFQNTAATTGTLTFHWRYTGFHAFFRVTAQLQVFAGGNTVTLYIAGPQDCCTTPSNGFDVQGTGTIPVTAGVPFGFVAGGGNIDSNSTLNGTLFITDFSIQ